MDRCLIAAFALSAGAHGLVLLHLPALGVSDFSRAAEWEMELSYLEESIRRGVPVPEGGMKVRSDSPPEAAPRRPAGGRKAAEKEPPRAPRMWRGNLKEVLRPLEPARLQSNPRRAAALLNYKIQLEKILEREANLSYPRGALEARREARYLVRFCLRADGTLESVYIPPRSGEFGAAIGEALTRAARRFPAFPDQIGARRLTFCWPVAFDLH